MSRAELRPFDQKLLCAIDEASAVDGAARSLFDVAVRRAGLDYAWAHHRLYVLESLGFVHVEHTGPGLPLIICPR